jgi:DNA-cytosine methyltransferase
MKKLKLLDTFSGIGGFSYAAEKLVGGFETTQFIEIDPYCQKVLKKHWPNVPIHDDITTFTAKPFQYDAVCGGFPCQDLSVAGKRAGITKESRSGLFYELMRVIRMVRPKYVILENVAAILNNGLDIVLGELSEAGYDAEWAVISASSLGACHRRSRWWLVAYPNNDGSSSSEKSRSIEKTDGRSEKRKNETCQSQRSSESKYTETFQFNATHSNSDGYQGQCFETRNKVASRQDTSSKWSTNTSELERQSDDGRNKTESRTDENLSGSSDGGKAISTITGKICDLSKGTNNDQRTSSQDNYQKNNDRTLVSERQSRVQLSQHRELGRDQTTLENNSIRQGDDNSENKRMDKQKSNVTNSHSNRLQGEVGSRTYRTIWRTQNIRRLNPNWRQYESKPVFRRGDDGLSDRTHRLKALGNSVVVQCAAIPLQRVLDLENE